MVMRRLPAPPVAGRGSTGGEAVAEGSKMLRGLKKISPLK
jgi:hypothetical protein